MRPAIRRRPRARSWRPARAPTDPANAAAPPFVKICGITDDAGIHAAIPAGADAIGLNLVPGTPRALTLDEAAALARLAPRRRPGGPAPRIVAVTADAGPPRLAEIVARRRPRRRPAQRARVAGARRRARSAGLEGAPPAGRRAGGRWVRRRPRVVGAGRALLAAGAERSSSTPPAARTRAGPGTRVGAPLAAAVAREVPVTLAGGLDPANVGRGASWQIPAVGVDVASGVEAPRVAGQRPRKDPLRVALFAKRARAARADRPTSRPARPRSTPACSRPTRAAAGAWTGSSAGATCPRRSWPRSRQLERAYARDPPRPALLGRAARAAGDLRRPPDAALPRRPAGRRRAGDRPAPARPEGDAPGRLPATSALYLKREDLAHTGAHKINNALGQALLTRRLGKTPGHRRDGRRPARRRDGNGVRAARPAVRRVHGRGGHPSARRRTCCGCTRSAPRSGPVTSGSATLKDAINEAMRDWVTNVETTHYVLGSAMGPHPYPTIVRDLQRVIGDEAAAQLAAVEGRLPDLVLACVGGGSNAIGLLAAVHRRAVGPARGRRGGGRRHRDRPPRGGARRRDAGDPPRRRAR